MSRGLDLAARAGAPRARRSRAARRSRGRPASASAARGAGARARRDPLAARGAGRRSRLVAATAAGVVGAGYWAARPRRASPWSRWRCAAPRAVPPQEILDGLRHRPGHQSLAARSRARCAARLEALPESGAPTSCASCPTGWRSWWRSAGPSRSCTRAGCTGSTRRAACSARRRRAVATEVPVISGLSEDELATMRTGARPAGARRPSRSSGRCCAPGSALAAEISEIDMSRPEGPVLYTVDGVEVRLGARGLGRAPRPGSRACWPRSRAAGRAGQRDRSALPRPGGPQDRGDGEEAQWPEPEVRQVDRRAGRRDDQDLRVIAEPVAGRRPRHHRRRASSPSRGLRKGVVVNIDSTVEAIKQAVAEAEQMAGVEIAAVLAGVAGGHIRGINSRGVVAVSGKHREVSQADVERALEAARAINLPQDREIIHVLPQTFVVDDQDGVQRAARHVGRAARGRGAPRHRRRHLGAERGPQRQPRRASPCRTSCWSRSPPRRRCCSADEKELGRRPDRHRRRHHRRGALPRRRRLAHRASCRSAATTSPTTSRWACARRRRTRRS